MFFATRYTFISAGMTLIIAYKIACPPLIHLLHFFARLYYSLPKICPKSPEKRALSIYLDLKIKALDPSHSFRMTVMRILNGF